MHQLFKQPLFKAKKTVTKKKPTGPIVFLLKLEFPEETPVKIELPKSLDELYKQATKALNLQRPAKHVFDEEGMPFTSIDEIPPKATLYVSSANIKTEENEDCLNIYKKKIPRKSPIKPLPLAKFPPPPPEPENKKEHNTIANVHNSVKDNLRDALVCLYSSLPEEQKINLNSGDSIASLIDEYQYYLLQHQLFAQFISPTKAVMNSDLGMDTCEYIYDKIKEIKVEFCKFVINGPPQSGKTTLLSLAALVFFQKLLIAKVAPNYLMVPINWKVQQGIINNPQKLYNFYVDITLNALKAVRLDLIPILPILQKWFESIIIMKSYGLFPPLVQNYTNFPHDKILEYGKKLHLAWFGGGAKFTEFMELLTQMPNTIAKIFDLTGVIYIIDHFDCCGYVVTKDSQSINLEHYISLAIKDCPFFVASQYDQDFDQYFEVEKYKTMTTVGIIQGYEAKSIILSNPSLQITFDMCNGCPGYCATFYRLIDIIDNAYDKPAIKRPNLTPFKSVVDIDRQTVAKQELIRFCLLLESSQSEELFDADEMNQLMVHDFDARTQ